MATRFESLTLPTFLGLALCGPADAALVARDLAPLATTVRRDAALAPAEVDKALLPAATLLPVVRAKAATTTTALDLRSAAVTLRLDAFGSFGRSTAGSDAQFDDGSRWAPTVFEYMAHVGGVGFLDSQALLLPPSYANGRMDGSAAVASYRLGAFQIDVRSELVDCDRPNCAVLEQDWTLTNRTTAPQELDFTLYLDGDLFFSGAYDNDFGAVADRTLYEFDEGSDPQAPSTFLGLSSEAPLALRAASEVGEYSEQRRRIRAGGLLSDRLVRATGLSADADRDGITDTGFDVTMARSHDFGSLLPGQSVQVRARVQWGIGRLASLGPAPVADAGPDRVVECAGGAGTVVTLDGTASTPMDDLAWFRWSVDGRPAGIYPIEEATLLPGEHVVVLEVEDVDGRRDTDEAVVTVVDTEPPAAEATVASIELWPPDHRMARVDLPVLAAEDACSPGVTLRVVRVECDELDDVRRGGDGNTSPDVVVDGSGTLWLRRERQGRGDGRVYRVTVEAIDGSGNATPVTFDVEVPHVSGGGATFSGAASVVSF
jgi:hypothetical protein